MMTVSGTKSFQKTRVLLALKVCAPAGSVALCPKRLDRKMASYMVEQMIEWNLDILLMPPPTTLTGPLPKSALLAPQIGAVHFREDVYLGLLWRLIPVFRCQNDYSMVEEPVSGLGAWEVPGQLLNLPECSSAELSLDERDQLADL